MVEWILQVIKEVAHRYDVSAWAMEHTLRCESGNFNLLVIQGHVLGAAGEQGIAQLHPQGLLPAFYKLGYDTPYSIYQAVDFMGRMFAQGLAWHWACFNVIITSGPIY